MYGGGSFTVPELKNYTFVDVVTSNADANDWNILCFNNINSIQNNKTYDLWLYADIHAGEDYIVSIKSKLAVQNDLKTVKFTAGYTFNVMKEDNRITSTQKLRVIAIYGLR